MRARLWPFLPAFIALVIGIQAAPVLPQNETCEITVSFPTGWILSVEKDGSGSLQFGQGPVDNGHFPASTFLFDELYRRLAEEGMSIGNIREDMWISFRGPSRYSVQYWGDQPVARKWTSHAFSKSYFFNRNHMNDILRKHPFVNAGKPE